MPDNYFARYLPILIHLVVVSALAAGMVLLSWLLGKHIWTPAKGRPYESGILPTGDARSRFSVKFYMVAMLFILFDVEIVFLYPWAIVFKDLGWFGFFEMLVYLAMVMLGYFYIVKKGVIDWSKPTRGEHI
jgi:NADH-quinone oxidoreductase subunit A